MTSLTLPNMEALLPWYQVNKRDLPWRKTDDPYRIWVSEIMLQQTRVEAVIPYYFNFLDYLPNVESLAVAPEALLLKLWEGLGYYSRVRNMQRAALDVMARFGGKFPQKYEDILSLCGIGEYTAGAIASFAFGEAVPAVDGNVLRVAARLAAYGGDIARPSVKKEITAAVAAAQERVIRAINDGGARAVIENETKKARVAEPENTEAQKNTSSNEENIAGLFNQAVMELGATVCLPNGAPRCAACPLAEACAAHQRGRETDFPNKTKKAQRRVEDRTVLLVRSGTRLALVKRPPTGLLAGLFEPPCLMGHRGEAELAAWFGEMGIYPTRIAPLGSAKHIFTHLEWHMEGFEVEITPHEAEILVKRAPFETFLLADTEKKAEKPWNGVQNLSNEVQNHADEVQNHADGVQAGRIFFAAREDLDAVLALPSAYRAYRPFM